MPKQPNSRMCFACGLENPAGLKLSFYDNGADQVTADFVVGPAHQGYPGVAHGGIVASILDEAGGRTVMIADHMRLFMTVKLEIKYRQPVPVDQPLRAVGQLLKLKNRLATAHAEIRTAAGQVLAEAELVLANAPEDIFNFDMAEADQLGWRVYPDEGAAD